MMKYAKSIIQFSFMVLLFVSCKKADFLNTKPDQSLVVPNSLSDFQAILDNDIYINGGINTGIVPSIGEVASDNYFLPNSTYNSTAMRPYEREIYIWSQNPYPGISIADWDYPYRAIFYSNVVLKGIASLHISVDEQSTFNGIKGSALFHRGHMFYQLAQVFAMPYKSVSANTDLGIPLRLTPDINESIERSNLTQTYNQIIEDLKNAILFLPLTAQYKTRPSKSAAYGLLARVYLTMQDYNNAYLYADSCLQLTSELIDFNQLNPSLPFPFQPIPIENNVEILFHCTLVRTIPILGSSTDTTLFESYSLDDLRRSVYFSTSTNKRFKGNYYGTSLNNAFAGIATDEIYLIRSECNARLGNKDAALDDLNTLISKRWKNNGSWSPFTANNLNEVLKVIIIERRKELLMRGLRWTDLRRLNMDSQYAKILERVINGETYTLTPNDFRYVHLIPDVVISYNPGMIQNPR